MFARTLPPSPRSTRLLRPFPPGLGLLVASRYQFTDVMAGTGALRHANVGADDVIMRERQL